MKEKPRFPDFDSPVVLFRVLIIAIAVIASCSFALIFYTTAEVESTAKRSSDGYEEALLATQVAIDVHELEDTVDNRLDIFLESPEVLALSPQHRKALEVELERDDMGPPNPVFSDLVLPLSLSEAVGFKEADDYLGGRLGPRPASGDQDGLQGVAEAEQYRRIMARYFDQPTIGNLRLLRTALEQLKVAIEERAQPLTLEAERQGAALTAKTKVFRYAALVFALVAAVLVMAFGRYISRQVQLIIEGSRAEQRQLAMTTSNLEFRNQQLNALYTVFSEITDTLSLRYVVKATIAESLKIMRSEMSVLRILRGPELVVAGAMTAGGQEIQGLPSVQLGEGPTGRTAKRGRTMRIDEGGERMMAPPDASEEDSPSAQAGHQGMLESGVIVPLIVGARVVGTLSCWSREKSAFDENDERILEMMASQVATAIVAAERTESSERQAHQDPLTSLPNRRQLDEDLDGLFPELARSGRHAVVAMADIDHFKRFNDEYGHRVGDVTLQKVASVLRDSVRDEDRVYRYGGEEFVVVFTDSDPDEAVALANRLRRAVESAPISGENLEPVGPVTISLGLAFLPEHGSDLNELITLADRAMYTAKLNGRNRVEIWDGETVSRDLTSVA